MTRSEAFGRALIGIVVVTIALAGIVPVGTIGVVNAQAGGATPIDSCTTIDRPGEYMITGRLDARSGGNCITIAASDVILDGGGHIVHGNGSDVGILVDGSAGAANVTVRNVAVAYWSYAIEFQGTDGGTIRDVTTFGSREGVTVIGSTAVTIENATARQNSLGIHLTDSEGSTVRNSVAEHNEWGVHFERGATNNTVSDTISRNNYEWDVYSKDDSTANRVERVTTRSGTFSFTPTNVALRGIGSPPSAPSDREGIGTYAETAPTSGTSSFGYLRVHYDDSGASREDEQSLSMWRFDNDSWREVPNSTVNAAANTVSTGRLTTFGVFAPFGRSGSNITAATPPSVAGTTTTPAPGANDPPVVFRQGGACYPVQPLGDGTTSVVDFYDYRSPYSEPNGTFQAYGPATRLEEANTSQVFLYNGIDGLSLVFVHDGAANNPASGGTVTADISGLPGSGNWTVLDDTYPRNDDVIFTRPGRAHFEWVWNFGERADGGAFTGLGARDWQTITIDAMFNERSVRYPFSEWNGPPEANHVDTWIARSGNGTTYDLDMSEPLSVTRGSCAAQSTKTNATATSAQAGTTAGTEAANDNATASGTGTGAGADTSSTTTAATTEATGPGFGLLAALVALLAAALLAARWDR